MVIYTAITGEYDDIIESVESPHEMRCFIDREETRESVWSFSQIPKEDDSCRQARQLKIMPQLLFDDVTVWVDGAIKIIQSLTEEKVEELLGDADVALFHHNKRCCIYQEALACLQFEKDDPEVIVSQRDRYHREGFPHNFGLASTGILIRRNTQAVRDFSEMWWSEVKKGSKRDQLSFDYCRWKTNLRVSYMRPDIYHNKLVECYYHDGRGPIR